MSLVIIINPVSGGGGDRGRDKQTLAAAALRRLGVDGRVLVSERRGHARDLAAAAVERGARVVASWGGDGTMNEVASAVVGTPAALALVPSGSGNGLARSLGIPRDVDRAIALARDAVPRLIDGGQCDGQWFFNLAGVGLDAHVAAAFDRMGTRRRGLTTYVRVTAHDALTYAPRVYRVDGTPTRAPALLITVANGGQFGNGAWIAPDARPDDGVLDLVVVEERSRLATLAALPRLFTRSIGRARGVTLRQVTRVVIEDDAPIAYHLDGEPRRGGARLDLQVRPSVLRICAP